MGEGALAFPELGDFDPKPSVRPLKRCEPDGWRGEFSALPGDLGVLGDLGEDGAEDLPGVLPDPKDPVRPDGKACFSRAERDVFRDLSGVLLDCPGAENRSVGETPVAALGKGEASGAVLPLAPPTAE